MRLPRPTTRRLMAAVALVALAMWGEAMRRRRASYLDMAEHCSIVAAYYRLDIQYGLRRFPPKPALTAYYDRLHRKYDRAARYPWLAAPPDPPAPE